MFAQAEGTHVGPHLFDVLHAFGMVLTWTVPNDDPAADVGIGGLIGLDPATGCVVLEPNEPAAGIDVRSIDQAILWPRGTELIDTDPLALDVPGFGRVSAGSEIQGTGSLAPPPPGIDIPAACLDEDGRVAYLFD